MVRRFTSNFVSSLVMGLAVNGVINVENNSQVFVGLPDPKPIFMFPIVFGGVTLFFVLSNIINMLVEILEMITNFWRCWEQVAFNYHFLWGQILSFPRLLVLLHIYALYLLRQIIIIFYNTFRENILPDIQFQTSAVGCIITVVLISF